MAETLPQSVKGETLRDSPGGIHCRFIDLGECGLKVYLESATRDNQFRNQTKLAALRLAPRCWGCTEFDGPNGGTLYAFYTDKVEVFEISEYNAFRDKRDLEGALGYRREWDFYGEYLESILADNGIYATDCHHANVGIDCDGNPVMIDCDFFDDPDGEFENTKFNHTRNWVDYFCLGYGS